MKLIPIENTVCGEAVIVDPDHSENQTVQYGLLVRLPENKGAMFTIPFRGIAAVRSAAEKALKEGNTDVSIWYAGYPIIRCEVD